MTAFPPIPPPAAPGGPQRPVAVVTGATGGIGRWIALGLAQAGHHVVLVGRDRARGEAALEWIAGAMDGASVELMLADLASLAQTEALGRKIARCHPRISILVANAGVFRTSRMVTSEGREEVLAVNHLSVFVLIRTLEPALRAGVPSRIVVVGSSTSDRARIDPADLELRRGWGMVRAYGGSKLAGMLTTFEWARRLHGSGVVANVVHPGTVATGLIRAPGVIGLAWRLMAPWSLTERQGAETPLHVALDPTLAGVTGRYFRNRAEARPNRATRDPALARRVWDETVRLTAPAAPMPPPPPSGRSPTSAG